MAFSHILYLLVALGIAVDACLLPEEMESDGSSSGVPKFKERSRTRRGNNFRSCPIGTGDRFSNGLVVPKGLGTSDRNLESILNVGEVQTGLRGLSRSFPEVKLFTAPYATYEKRRVYGAVIGEPRVFIQSGIHARERGGPDNVLYFISDLLAARRDRTGLTYGNQTYSNTQVEKALSAGIALIPLLNPDGVAFDQKTDSCWRKNRNPKSALPSSAKSIGVDLNRNYQVNWDYSRLFNKNPNGAPYFGAASDDPGSEVFHGTAPLSEPETRNSVWVMEQYTQISWFLDLHSYTGDVLYTWGDDDSQTTDARQNLINNMYDGKRGFVGQDPADSQYREYIEAKDLSDQKSASRIMSDAMNKAGGIRYSYKPSANLYPTAGTSTDHALGMYYSRTCGARRIQGLTLEFGKATEHPRCGFYPDNRRYHESMRQVAAALMELLLNAAGDAGSPRQYQCNTATL